MSKNDDQYGPYSFDTILNRIFELNYPDFGKAEALRLHLKEIAQFHFVDHTIYLSSIESIHFTFTKKTMDKVSWNKSIENLLSIAFSMQNHFKKTDSATKNEKKKSPRNVALLLISLVATSICLWTFNNFAHWSWLYQHPRKIAIYCAWQLIIILIIYFVYKNERINFIHIILPIILALIPLF